MAHSGRPDAGKPTSRPASGVAANLLRLVVMVVGRVVFGVSVVASCVLALLACGGREASPSNEQPASTPSTARPNAPTREDSPPAAADAPSPKRAPALAAATVAVDYREASAMYFERCDYGGEGFALEFASLTLVTKVCPQQANLSFADVPASTIAVGPEEADEIRALIAALQEVPAPDGGACEVYDGTLRRLTLRTASGSVEVGYEQNCGAPKLDLRVDYPSFVALRARFYTLAKLPTKMRPT